jgi:hypothetical protein
VGPLEVEVMTLWFPRPGWCSLGPEAFVWVDGWLGDAEKLTDREPIGWLTRVPIVPVSSTLQALFQAAGEVLVPPVT